MSFSRAVPFLLLVVTAQAAPPSSVLLYNRDGSSQALAAVGKISASLTCSGVLIRPPQATSASPAYYLTAGHCISLDPWAVTMDRAVSFNVDFNYFADTRDAVIRVRAIRVLWAAMKGTDLALLELDATVGDLAAKGLQPYPLAATPPRAGEPVWWAGMPSSFIPQGESYLRRGACSALGSTAVIEDRWFWFDEIRNDCPDVYAGASGSPLFNSSNAVAGVLGTSTNLNLETGPDYDCYRDHPCVPGAQGMSVESDTSYASPVAALATCFDNGRFTLSGGCLLDKGIHLIPNAGGVVASQPIADGKPAAWNVRLTGTLPYYAWKQTPIAAGDCRDRAGYSQPVALASAPVITAELEPREGEYLLCVVAGPTPDIGDSWQPFRVPTVVRRTLDAHPLTAIPDYGIDYTGLAYRLTVDGSVPAAGDGRMKRGEPASTDCADPEGYRIMIWVPPVIFPSDFPHRICIRYADKAGNWSPPMQFDFGPPAIAPFALTNTASGVRVRAAAPGSLFRVDAVELTSTPAFSARLVPELAGIRAELTDARGVRHQVLLNEVSKTYLSALMPVAAAQGPAHLAITLPSAQELSLDLEVSNASPGIYAADYRGSGPPLGYLFTADGAMTPLFQCQQQAGSCAPREVSWDRSKPAELFVYGTGFGPSPVKAKVGAEAVEVMAVDSDRDWPGVTSIRLRLPAGFGLRGYQILQVGDSVRLLLLR